MRAPQCLAADVLPFSWVDGPGNRFVLFLQGCNFNCLACHNPHTIPTETPRAQVLDIPDVLARIRTAMPYISGITVSGGEATVQWEFVRDLFAAVKAAPDLARLTTYIDSNGHAPRAVWDALAPVTDGVMVDLKALDDEVHRFLTGESNAVVLESLHHLHDLGLLAEVRLLLVPGHNDSDDALRRTAAWLREVDPAVPVRINLFRAHGVRAAARDWAEPSEEDAQRYRSVLDDAGLLLRP